MPDLSSNEGLEVKCIPDHLSAWKEDGFKAWANQKQKGVIERGQSQPLQDAGWGWGKAWDLA